MYSRRPAAGRRFWGTLAALKVGLAPSSAQIADPFACAPPLHPTPVTPPEQHHTLRLASLAPRLLLPEDSSASVRQLFRPPEDASGVPWPVFRRPEDSSECVQRLFRPPEDASGAPWQVFRRPEDGAESVYFLGMCPAPPAHSMYLLRACTRCRHLMHAYHACIPCMHVMHA